MVFRPTIFYIWGAYYNRNASYIFWCAFFKQMEAKLSFHRRFFGREALNFWTWPGERKNAPEKGRGRAILQSATVALSRWSLNIKELVATRLLSQISGHWPQEVYQPGGGGWTNFPPQCLAADSPPVNFLTWFEVRCNGGPNLHRWHLYPRLCRVLSKKGENWILTAAAQNSLAQEKYCSIVFGILNSKLIPGI